METKPETLPPNPSVASPPAGPAVASNLQAPSAPAVESVSGTRTPRPRRREGVVYEANREALLRDHEGEWVVILGDEILGTWPTEEEAMGAGINRYGGVSFLCREITSEPDPTIYYPHDLP